MFLQFCRTDVDIVLKSFLSQIIWPGFSTSQSVTRQNVTMYSVTLDTHTHCAISALPSADCDMYQPNKAEITSSVPVRPGDTVSQRSCRQEVRNRVWAAGCRLTVCPSTAFFKLFFPCRLLWCCHLEMVRLRLWHPLNLSEVVKAWAKCSAVRSVWHQVDAGSKWRKQMWLMWVDLIFQLNVSGPDLLKYTFFLPHNRSEKHKNWMQHV